MLNLTTIIASPDPAVRNQSLDLLCKSASLEELTRQCHALDDFRRSNENLYERVRALFFLYAIYRFHLPNRSGIGQRGLVPFRGYEHLLHRRFEEAIDHFLS